MVVEAIRHQESQKPQNLTVQWSLVLIMGQGVRTHIRARLWQRNQSRRARVREGGGDLRNRRGLKGMIRLG
jgi:hypothetical protein